MSQLTHVLFRPIPLKLFGKVVKVPLIIILFILSAVAGIVLTRQQLLKGKWQTFTHDKYGFSIDYPAGWSADDYGAGGWRGVNYLRAQFIGSIGSNARVFIHQQPMENPNLEDAVEWGQEIIKRREPYDVSSPVEAQVGYGNYPALTQTYRDRSIVGVGLTKVFYVVTADSAFMLEFTDFQSGYEKTEALFDHMLATFRFVDDGANP